jgi:hypothetical protein
MKQGARCRTGTTLCRAVGQHRRGSRLLSRNMGIQARQRPLIEMAIITEIGEHLGQGDYDGRLANFLFASLFSLQKPVNNKY